MSVPRLRLLPAAGSPNPSAPAPGWLEWLRAHLDPGWRPGEWDADALLFTGDLASNRTAAWPCRTGLPDRDPLPSPAL